MSLHEHNEGARIDAVLDALGRGERICVVSDAGTPGISDPGSLLVAAAVASGVDVTTVPGPSALLGAIVVSGLPTDRFVMEGFLPRKGAERTERIAGLTTETRTVVLYESPRRVAATMADLAASLDADRPVVVVRELTKIHEEIWRGTLVEAVAHYDGLEVRGEVVVVLGGATIAIRPEPDDEEILAAIEASLAKGMSTKDAARAVAESLKLPRRRVYQLATERAPGSPR